MVDPSSGLLALRKGKKMSRKFGHAMFAAAVVLCAVGSTGMGAVLISDSFDRADDGINLGATDQGYVWLRRNISAGGAKENVPGISGNTMKWNAPRPSMIKRSLSRRNPHSGFLRGSGFILLSAAHPLGSPNMASEAAAAYSPGVGSRRLLGIVPKWSLDARRAISAP